MVKKVILVVDDEPNIRLLVKSVLDSDYEVIEASGGNEAFEIINNRKMDLILLDIMMPEIDGYTLCSAIKNSQITKEIPVIMVTGLDLELNKTFAERLGANGYLTKPFKVEELLRSVKQMLAKTELVPEIRTGS